MALFKQKFKRQEVTEDYVPEKVVQEVDEEEEEEFVPQPVRKPIQQVQSKPVEVKPDWTVEEISTATQPVIYNSKTKKAYTIYEAIAEILNRSE